MDIVNSLLLDIPIEAILGLMIPITALMIPIVAIMSSHQRKMAELTLRNQGQLGMGEIYALRNEIAELKQIVHQQAIALDNVVSAQTARPIASEESIQDRLSTR